MKRNTALPEDNNDITFEDRDGIVGYNQRFKALLHDLFDRINLNRNLTLEIEELNFIGALTGNERLQNYTGDDFQEGGALFTYSSNELGLTRLGAIQLFHDIASNNPDEFMEMASKLGYDLQNRGISLKERVFNISILSSDCEIEATFIDQKEQPFYKVANTLFMHKVLQDRGPNDYSETLEDEQCSIFVDCQEGEPIYNYALINESNYPKKIKVDLSGVNGGNCLTAPADGKVEVELDPEQFMYIGTALAMHGKELEDFDPSGYSIEVETIDE